MNLRKPRLVFGLDVRRGISGASLYVKIFQIISLLPLFYIFTATAYMGITSTRNVLSVLFDLGMSTIPRTEALILSYVYRISSSECMVYFALLAIAIILGFTAERFLKGNAALSLKLHKAFAILIAVDLIIRVVPVHANIAFGLPAAVFGFAVRAGFLYLIIRDIKAS